MLMFVSDIGTTATGTGYGWLLPALLVLCLAVIAVLAAVIVRQRRLINLKNKYIVCRTIPQPQVQGILRIKQESSYGQRDVTLVWLFETRICA